MSDNKHIIDYLKYYLKTDSPEFAVMLKGKWGSGKTWFINNFTESIKEEGNGEKFIYISLYGLTDVNGIDVKIFESLHPILSSKGMKLAGKFLKGAVKLGLKVDLNGDGKDESVTTSVPDVKLSEILSSDTNDYTLIFDDLERSNIIISDLMGYINYFVEHQSIKTIIIGNEDEIDSEGGYSQIKEKLIGPSFEINAQLDSFLEKNLSIKPIIKKFDKEIRQVFNLSNCMNLRVLKRALLDYERIIEHFDETVLDNHPFMSEFTSIFFSLGIEFYLGNVKSDELDELNTLYMAYKTSKDKNTLSDGIKSLFSKYPLDFYNLTPAGDFYSNFFGKNIISEDLCLKVLENHHFNSAKPDWLKLWQLEEISASDFNESISRLIQKVRMEELFTDYGDFLHTVGLLIHLIESDVIKDFDLDEFKEIMLKSITTIPKESLCDYPLDRTLRNDSYGGYGYYNKQHPVFKELKKCVEDTASTEQSNELDSIGRNYIKGNFEEFESSLYHSYGVEGSGKFYNSPILKNMNVEEFWNEFIKIPARCSPVEVSLQIGLALLGRPIK